MTSANTNDMPIVLSWPMSCHVVGEVGATALSAKRYTVP